MKDIQISGKSIKKEITIFALVFIFAYLLNVISIIIYKTPWNELYTSLALVLGLTLAIYLLISLIRFLIHIVVRIFSRKGH